MTTPNIPSQPTPPVYRVPAWKPPTEAPEVALYQELAKAADGPGEMFNMMRGKHLEDVRDEYEASSAVKGVLYEMEETADGPRASVEGFESIPAFPGLGGRPAGWDPKQFAPHYVFDAQEDAFPVRPDFDGDGDTSNNGGSTLADTTSDHYRDGEIGGDQALSSAFVVSQKDEYTVLTYSNYYATNKGAHYHKNDYSTAQVYLKPDANGQLQPEFLATSWHYGTQLTKWEDVKKDAQGHPVIEVGLGTHSLQPLGQDQDIPTDGLHIQGDGQATRDGVAIGHQLTYDAFQDNVLNAEVLSDPDSDRAVTRRKTLGYGMTAADPLKPETFFKDNTAKQLEARLEDDLEDVEDHAGDEQAGKQALIDAARKVGVKDPESYENGVLDTLGDFIGL